jgi:hypothetical protein
MALSSKPMEDFESDNGSSSVFASVQEDEDFSLNDIKEEEHN